MALFPGLAAAEENSGIQYETDVPTVPNQEGSNIPSKKNSGGSNPSGDQDAEASGANSPGGVGSGGGDGSGTGAGAGTGQGNQASGGGDGKAANGAKPAGDVGSAQKLEVAPASSGQSSDDGSSPLVPILIAIAVLAAISIGAYYYRQRRQGPDSTVAPPAS